MQTRHDQLAKQVLSVLLGLAGPVRVQQEVTAEAQWIDVWFPAEPLDTEALGLLGLLGRLAAEPCLLEPFSRTPGITHMRHCHRKLYNWHHLLCREAERELPMPQMWLLSPGRPEQMIEAYGLQPAAEEPGVYRNPSRVLGLGLVVLSELAGGRETLSLRLLGRGATQHQALKELRELPPEAWDRKALVPVVARLRFELEAEPGPHSSEEEELLMSLKQTFEEFQQELLLKGLDKGMRESLRKALVVLYKARHGACPPELRAGIEATESVTLLDQWLQLFETATAEQIRDEVLGSALGSSG